MFRKAGTLVAMFVTAATIVAYSPTHAVAQQATQLIKLSDQIGLYAALTSEFSAAAPKKAAGGGGGGKKVSTGGGGGGKKVGTGGGGGKKVGTGAGGGKKKVGTGAGGGKKVGTGAGGKKKVGTGTGTGKKKVGTGTGTGKKVGTGTGTGKKVGTGAGGKKKVGTGAGGKKKIGTGPGGKKIGTGPGGKKKVGTGPGGKKDGKKISTGPGGKKKVGGIPGGKKDGKKVTKKDGKKKDGKNKVGKNKNKNINKNVNINKNININKNVNVNVDVNRGVNRFWFGDRWATFVGIGALAAITVGSEIFDPDGYVAIARPYCTGVSVNGCQLNWQSVALEEGGEDVQCVQYCPRAIAGAAPVAQAEEVPLVAPALARGQCELVIYSEVNLKGESAPTNEDQPQLSEVGWLDEISSLEVKSGTWDFYVEEDYAGAAMRLKPGTYNMLGQEWTKNIGSFQCANPS